MTYDISDAQVAEFRAHGPAIIEAYLESKGWQRNRSDSPRNIWYWQKTAWNLCPYCDDPDGPIKEDPYCPAHDDATWALVWPYGDGATAYDALRTLCQAEERGPEKILHALTLRGRDEVRARGGTSFWKDIATPSLGIEFFATLNDVLALTAGPDEGPESPNKHPYAVELVSESEVLFSFPHDEPPTRGKSPSASRQAAQLLYAAACGQEDSDRGTHVATRYATGEWTTVEVLGPEDLPPSTPLENNVSSLVHQFGLRIWTFDLALPSKRLTSSL
ncbi:predicted protein [Streptomyces viridochromogenes DSM 40736]|uniref:Predicted protein n=1 Tax=Streptomyces viridochromogenes (strain DSM 40736 / JCM 4977 / BCRC 1201 / Tue 494) TaxID=591159 RepID=D9X0H5_STRVT|nr:hypothetical protein [Streptomyces viridochromogenes]EFL35559.1 predicted protein [Streptomyces viridochromogenes DSM 40736]